MTIDKAKLIELLIEKTGLEGKQVEDQLSQLIRRIQQAAEQGKSFQIEGFGTFSVKDATLHFEPADILETEINQKYAGMKPLELVGAFSEMPSAEEPAVEEEEQEEEDIFGIEELPDAHADPEGVGEKYLQKPKTSFVFDTEDTEENPASRKAGKKKEKKDTLGTALIVCVIIIVIGVAGWAIYDLGLLSVSEEGGRTTNENPQTTRFSANQPQKTGEQAGQYLSGAASGFPGTGAPEQNAANPVPSKKEDTEIQTGSSVYGLSGTIRSEANDGYTIVVHSLVRRSKAQAIQDSLVSQGYRVILVSAIVEGNTYWRVGLGQFETVAEAQKAIDTLPESFRTNHFIKRIQ